FLDELFGSGHRFCGIGLIVLYEELDFLAQHATGLVGVLLGDLGALRDVIAGCGECAGERLRDADLERALGERSARRQQRASDGDDPSHISAPFTSVRSGMDTLWRANRFAKL